MATVQGIYLALFGRPADPGGLAYFNDITNKGADLAKIGVLSGQPEYTSRFTGFTNEQIINSIYQSLFGRDGEPAGVSFWLEKLTSGALSINNIAIAILDSAQGNDKAIVEAKLAAADLFTTHLDTAAEIAAYSGDGAAALARAYISGINASNPGTDAGVDAVIQSVVTSGGQVPGGGGGGGGGDDGPSEPAPTFQKTYGDLTATFAVNELYAGKGNPADGFAKAVNTSENIELGLDVRKYMVATEIAPTEGTKWIVPPSEQNDLRFAYSVSADKGLDSYDFKLLIDTDPSSGTSFQTFNLVKDADVEAHSFNNSDSQFDWVLASNSAVKIEDDGGDAAGKVSQNIQSLQWYTSQDGRMAGDEHVIKLQAFDKSSGAVLAETEATIKYAGHTERAVEDFNGDSDMVLTDIGGTQYGSVGVQSDGTALFLASNNDTGPFTRFDGYRTDKPDVVTTSIDIKLVAADIGAGEGFSYSVAANKADNTHMRDYIFHVANDGGNLVVSASNNSGATTPIIDSNKQTINTDGWYTFKHTMYKNADGDVEVLLQVFEKEDPAHAVFSWTSTNTADDFTNYGGNRYGWFSNLDVNEGVKVDNWAIAAQYFDNNPVA